ncbi:hypothetical protein [Rhodoligotrophos appendicifer]|uniref:hypothetical protein n=1 Tax=Rhodoligotrophos appendicifer TaxID=987056 RepID=UPI003D221B9B
MVKDLLPLGGELAAGAGREPGQAIFERLELGALHPHSLADGAGQKAWTLWLQVIRSLH